MLHPALRERWEYLVKAWRREYPRDPQPFLTATYRGPEDQQKAFVDGKSMVQFGGSLHNYKPALAFDIAFMDEDRGKVTWDWEFYERAAELLKPTGLEWGGDWEDLRDGVHFQMPMSEAEARLGEVPDLPGLDGEPIAVQPQKVVLMVEGEVKSVVEVPEHGDVVVRYSPDRRRIYVDARKDG